MNIRDVRKEDTPRLHELYVQQGFDYAEPDWSEMIGKVLVDENDFVLAYELGRRTIETYAGIDKGDWAAPGMKAEYFRRLDKAAIQGFRKEGYTDQGAWVPPQCKAFIRRMLRELAWVKAEGYVPLVRWFG